MQNTFNDYNPANDDNIPFDMDDLVGISLLDKDPLYKKQTVLKNLFYNVVDESTTPEDINSVTNSIQFDVEETVPEPDYSDLEKIDPDDSDVTQDGMDAEDLMDSASEILSGEADDESDLIDQIERD